MPTTAASKSSQKLQGETNIDSDIDTRPQERSTAQQQTQQLPYNNMLLSGLNTSTILASEPSRSLTDNTAAIHPSTTTITAIPSRPRRLWKVVDTKLPKYPALYYPPPSPYTSCVIVDPTTTPSIVAIRIAECLLQRNVCAEYDEEAAIATVLTDDSCVMQIHLWRFSNQSTRDAVVATTAILVECVRTSGPVQTFHWTTQAVLQAAQGLDSGADHQRIRRRPFQASSLEYVRYCNNTNDINKKENNMLADEQDERYDDDDNEYYSTTAGATTSVLPSSKSRDPDAVSAAALEALDYAYSLLMKDRLEAQQLGMEWLVSLTDMQAVGINAALYHSLALLGGMQSTLQPKPPPLARILYRLIVDKQAPNEKQQDVDEPTTEPPQRNTTRRRLRVFGPGFSNSDDDTTKNDEPGYPYQDHHASSLRSMALRVLVNALTLLSIHQRTVLQSLLLHGGGSSSSSHTGLWTSHALIQALTDDLQGASRPPTAVLHSTGRLASCHEACLAVQCLGVLAEHNVEAQRMILQNDSTLLWLERARTVGRSTNMVLYEHAEKVYAFFTETERSC